ncbi:MAG: hypothetical protein AMXMBFR82_17920 [Candidatus Hydrogenedentota bacterium]
MSSHFDDVASQALKLPVRDRVRLAQTLTSSIEQDIDDGADDEALWIAEAQRRLDEMREGKVEEIDAADAFARARKHIRE